VLEVGIVMKKVLVILILYLCLLVILILNILLLNLPKIKIEGGDLETVEVFNTTEIKEANLYLFNKKIPSKIKVEENIDFNKVGTYKVVYKANYGIIPIKKIKTVEVVDTTSPTIELKGEEELSICPNAEYEESGYEAKDNYDGDLTDKVKIEKVEDGIIYTVEDSSGNKTQVKRNIKKEDTESPIIQLYGSKTIYLSLNETFKESGYEATDNCSGDITKKVTISSNLDTSKIGSYTKVYTVTDDSGNETTINRNIVVREVKKTTLCVGEKGVIYLTFDDGPNAIYTPKILDVLKKYNVKATFFVTMAGPDSLIKREYEEGHTVALHTATHNYKTVYTSVNDYFNDLYKVQNRVNKIIGIKPTIIRFPGGSSNTVSRKYQEGIMSILTNMVEEKGFKYYDWNISSGDAGGTTDPNVEYHNVVSNLSKNCSNIVLMHDIKKHTSEAIEDIVKYGLDNGYTFKAITENTEEVHQKVNN
jgi:peptidoglycan/xylan/chitin deacetylase (PgdA/CDA1 family)